MKKALLLCLFFMSSFAFSMRSAECMYMKELRTSHIIAADIYWKLAWDAYDNGDYRGWEAYLELYDEEIDAADHLDGAMQAGGCFN